MTTKQPTIVYTLTDEAPFLATASFLPIVRTFAAEKGIALEDVSLADMKSADARINDDVFSVLSVDCSVNSRVSYGGTALVMLFLGLGAEIAIPPRALIATLEDVGIMAEPMNTPSAARSYNVTLSEGRRVACALIPL